MLAIVGYFIVILGKVRENANLAAFEGDEHGFLSWREGARQRRAQLCRKTNLTDFARFDVEDLINEI